MRTIVMGGGVIGVTTAYYLAKAGAQVTVLERRPEAGQETSFANAGLIAPGHANAWASPRAPLTLLKSLWREDTALRFRFSADPRLWAWGLRFLANCTAARNRVNTLRKFRLCLYAREALIALRRETGIDYQACTQGALYLYREAAHLRTGVATMQRLAEHGLTYEAVDRDRCVELEPAFAPVKDRIAGAIHCPLDESGDCHLFTRNLAALCAGMGVDFRYGVPVAGLRTAGDRITAVLTDRGEVAADAYVLALASYSPEVARSVGLRLPIYPVKGYSLTVPVGGRNLAPTLPGVDEHYLVAFARLGDRLRLTATAEFAGYDTGFTARDFAPMLRLARELFPDGGDYDRPDYFACLRPMTPDGPPILGRARHRNLYLNTGHGHIGWTMACGSGRITADLVTGKEPELELAGLTVQRY
jgi:D-amino-acid dehydrogenase